jgi:Putative peptidoglycan binding domain
VRRAPSCWKLPLLAFALLIAATGSSAQTAQSPAGTPATKTASSTVHHSGNAKTSATTAHPTSRGKKSHRRRASWRKRGQQKIDSERARQIQEALVREGYLDGRPSGVWDSDTQSAMVRYQMDHGWQGKVVPDARALIELGLGPEQRNLLNPETAMTTHPLARITAVSTPSLPGSNSARSAPTSMDPVSGPAPPADPSNETSRRR